MSKNLTHKIKGITIIEMMIVLIIISFMILLMVQTRLFFLKQSGFINKVNATGASFYRLALMLEKDFNDKETFWVEDEKALVCYKDDIEVYYTFNKDIVIRKQLHLLDTFNLQTIKCSIEGYTKGEKVNMLVSKVFFNIIYQGQEIPIFIHKDIPVNQILQNPLDKRIQYTKWE